MKFAINNSYNLGIGANAATRNTKGLRLFDKLFGKVKDKDESKIESLDNDNAAAEFELNGNIELSVEVSAEEFSELSKFNKENSLLNREELSWLYSGCRKAVANLAQDIKAYGKEISDACWDVNDAYEEREFKSNMTRDDHNSELDLKRTENVERVVVEKEKIRKQYSNKESKKD